MIPRLAWTVAGEIWFTSPVLADDLDSPEELVSQ
jgi:hypothetical protein